MPRAVYFSNVLGVDMGMFYKRRDYSTVVNGKNPIVAHEFLGDDVDGKTVIIIDDMISSGESMLDVAKQMKDRGASVYLYVLLLVSSQKVLTNSMNIMKKASWTGDHNQSDLSASSAS